METKKVTYIAKHNRVITENIETKNFDSIMKAIYRKQEQGKIRNVTVHN